MAIYFASRHPGARHWAVRNRLAVNHFVEHLNPAVIAAGDTVIGSLPVHLAAAVCARGARYLHLSLELAREQRGRELGAEDMRGLGARLEEFRVTPIPDALPVATTAPGVTFACTTRAPGPGKGSTNN